MRRVVTTLAVLASCGLAPCGLAGCGDRGEPPFEVFDLVSGSVSVVLPCEPSWILERTADRILLEHEDVRVRVQAVETRGELEATARALVRRYALGEQVGELTTERCRYAGRDAWCVEGTFELGGESWVRRGALLQVGVSTVWIDVLGNASAIDSVEARNDEVRLRAAIS